MRRAAKVDDNHGLVVRALRAAGWQVESLAPLGRGIPDLLVAKAGLNMLLEVKDGRKPPSARVLTLAESRFFGRWPGAKAIVESPEEAIEKAEAGLASFRRTAAGSVPRANALPWPRWTASGWRILAAAIRHISPARDDTMAADCDAMAEALEKP